MLRTTGQKRPGFRTCRPHFLLLSEPEEVGKQAGQGASANSPAACLPAGERRNHQLSLSRLLPCRFAVSRSRTAPFVSTPASLPSSCLARYDDASTSGVVRW